MKAAIINQYGPPEVLQLADVPDPQLPPDHVLVKVAAASINPIDLGRRSGRMKEIFPVDFPGILGADLAGTIIQVGSNVQNFAIGDRVFAMANHTYAELVAVPAANLAKIPDGLSLTDAAALPLVTTTGKMLADATNIQSGQTLLITGAVGSVGRSAVATAKQRGAKVIAGVRAKQMQEAASLGVDEVVATDDETVLHGLAPLDAVADAVNGKTAAALLSKVKNGGVFASVLGPPSNAKDFPQVRIVPVYARPNPQILLAMANAVLAKKLTIPIAQQFPLAQAAKAHALVEQGASGKVLLIP